MALSLFTNIVNTIQERIVYLSSKQEYFNSWYDGSAPGNVFCRKTKLTLKIVFWLIVSRIVQSLPVSLSAFFDQMDLPIPGKGAFSMKRALIKSSFFEDISNSMVSKYYENRSKLKTFHGYVVLACDGSRIALPDVDELGQFYGYYHTYQGENLYPAAKSAIYQDTLNNITVLARLVGKDVDERHTFEDTFSYANELAGGNTIMTVDRGYFSYLLMYLMIKSHQLFVMKSRSSVWQRRFIDSGKKETTVRISPSRATSIYKNKQWLAETDKTLTLRLVRFDHPDGTSDVLITNIPPSRKFSAGEIVRLYCLRWPAETAYGVYKNDMALELFSSFRKDGVMQDFHAAIIMYNLASIMAAECGKIPGGRKPDMNVAVGLIHNICSTLASEIHPQQLSKRIKTDVEYLRHTLTYILPGRSFKRIRRKRKTSGKFYRHTNFAIAV